MTATTANDDNAPDPAAPVTEPAVEPPVPERVLTPAAQRALAEAAERRAAIDAKAAALTAEREVAGRGGLEPVRYDDWEIKGLTVDF